MRLQVRQLLSDVNNYVFDCLLFKCTNISKNAILPLKISRATLLSGPSPYTAGYVSPKENVLMRLGTLAGVNDVRAG